MKFTHEQLVNVARKWLARYCAVVITELVSSGSESPDALGFTHGGGTTLIECKASVADYKADQKKTFRVYPDIGLGAHRYYLTPVQLLEGFDLPESWGLLEWNGKRVRKIKESQHFAQDGFAHAREKLALISVLRRLGVTSRYGVAIKCYQFDYDNKHKATVGWQRNWMPAVEGE